MQGRAATCQLRSRAQLACACAHTQSRHYARCLSGGGAARALAARARRAMLVVAIPCPIEGHCTSERALSFGARPCCDVPAAVSRTAGLRVCTHAIATLRSLSLGRRRSTRACRARALCHAGCRQFMPYGRPLHQREVSLYRCKAVLLRRASCGVRRQASAASRMAQAHRRSLSLGRRRSTIG